MLSEQFDNVRMLIGFCLYNATCFLFEGHYSVKKKKLWKTTCTCLYVSDWMCLECVVMAIFEAGDGGGAIL